MRPQAVLTFDEVAEHMDIKAEDVEQWIVRVVSSGIADCKIRQQVCYRSRRVVSFSSVVCAPLCS